MPDPYLEIRGGPGHPDPEIRWEGGRSPIFFFGPLFGLKLRGAVPPGPSPESASGEEGWGWNSGRCPVEKLWKSTRVFNRMSSRYWTKESVDFIFHNYGCYKATHKELPNVRCWQLKEFLLQTGRLTDLLKPLLNRPHGILPLMWKCYIYQFRFMGNCPPTPPLSQHYHLLLTQGKILLPGRVGGQFPRNLNWLSVTFVFALRNHFFVKFVNP